MYTLLHKVDALVKAIELIMSKNRHVFLIEDFELLQGCLDELEKLKEEVIRNGGLNKKSKIHFLSIIKLLDFFFGCSDNILDFFDDLN